MTIEDQPGFDPRLAWASEGGTLLASVCPVLVVVDVLRFTIAVEVAVAHGAQVVPERWPDRDQAERVARRSPTPAPRPSTPAPRPALLAGPVPPPFPAPPSTRSPPDPYLGSPPAPGWRWPRRTGPPSAWPGRRRGGGAGRVPAQRLGGGHPSPEARAAVAAFLDAASHLPAALSTCASGRELAARGLATDLRLAAEHDVSRAVPLLSGGAFAQLS